MNIKEDASHHCIWKNDLNVFVIRNVAKEIDSEIRGFESWIRTGA